MASAKRVWTRDTRLLEIVLDQESELRDLRCLIIAMNLMLSGSEDIKAEELPGARHVARKAWQTMDQVFEAWRGILAYAKLYHLSESVTRLGIFESSAL